MQNYFFDQYTTVFMRQSVGVGLPPVIIERARELIEKVPGYFFTGRVKK
jgi:hypothetical protein